MNRSPLFLHSLNKIIGRTMRQLQLHKARGLDWVVVSLKSSLRWLNEARRNAKASLMPAAMICLELAAQRMSEARREACYAKEKALAAA